MVEEVVISHGRRGRRKGMRAVVGRKDSDLKLLALLAVALSPTDEEKRAGLVERDSRVSVVVGFDGIRLVAAVVVLRIHLQHGIGLAIVLENLNK